MILRVVIALVAGAVFGLGLTLSGMVDPMRVRSFLDLFGGAWDPTLAFVMAGALLPMACAWLLQRRLKAPLAAPAFSLPETRAIDGRLLGGAVLFGIGWGIAGICPGPALADLALRPMPTVLFVGAMLLGFGLHALTNRER